MRIAKLRMMLPPWPGVAAALACLSASAMAQTAWLPVPGAPDVQIALDSMQVERSAVVVWVRWPGRHALLPELGAQGAQAPRIQRTALRIEFDCGHRTLRVLVANAYASSGAPMFMTDTPGAVRPVTGDEMAWAYDAACEAARAGARS